MPSAGLNNQAMLSLCWGSMEGVTFDDFLDAAAAAGFDAVTLNTALYLEARVAGHSDDGIKKSIADRGLFVSGIDPLFNWLPSSVTLDGNDPISLCSQASAEDVFQLARIAGTDLVNAPLGLASPGSEQEIVDCFALLCEQAASWDLRVSLEFMPFTQVSNLEIASRIIEQAGQTNGGLMFDCWHHHRGGGTADDVLRIPGERFFALQLDDALADPMDDMLEETLNHRLLPGEGCIDLVTTLENLQRKNPSLVYDVEVFHCALRLLPSTERAQRMYDSATSILAGIKPPA